MQLSLRHIPQTAAKCRAIFSRKGFRSDRRHKAEKDLGFLADFAAGFQEKVRGPFNDRREAFRSTLKTRKKWR
jgi:hypothetical protein